ncbi:Secreted protein OS=Streptomyces glaucescens OX=1907 GN=SGLAU_31890 PE=4 SV=1 [Streptomyces glaucescens]
MHKRALGMPFRRARKRSAAAAAALTAAALATAVLPGANTATAADQPVSAWGPSSPDFEMPAVKVGPNRPVQSEPSKNPTDELYVPWQREQRERVERPVNGSAGAKHTSSRTTAASSSTTSIVPDGQGDVPDRYLSFAITDTLRARIDYSTGNLMLTATDFDIAGVGQRLQLALDENAGCPVGCVSSAGGSSTSVTCRPPAQR